MGFPILLIVENYVDESLKTSLQRWQRIGGFHDELDGITAYSLTNLVSGDITATLALENTNE